MRFTPQRVRDILAEINMMSEVEVTDDIGPEVDRVTRKTKARAATKRALAAQSRALLRTAKES